LLSRKISEQTPIKDSILLKFFFLLRITFSAFFLTEYYFRFKSFCELNLVKLIFIVVLLFIFSFVNVQYLLELVPVTSSSYICLVPVSATGLQDTFVSGETSSVLPVMSEDEFIQYLPGIEEQTRRPAG